MGTRAPWQSRKLAPKHRIRFWPIDSIVTAQERRYLLADSAMEIFLKDHTTKLFNFPSTEGPHSSRLARSKVRVPTGLLAAVAVAIARGCSPQCAAGVAA